MKSFIFSFPVLLMIFMGFVAGAQQEDKEIKCHNKLKQTCCKLSADTESSVAAPPAGPEKQEGLETLSLQPDKPGEREPLVFLNGRRVEMDFIEHKPFAKITLIRGPQAYSILGPAASEGLWIVKTFEESRKLNDQRETQVEREIISGKAGRKETEKKSGKGEHSKPMKRNPPAELFF